MNKQTPSKALATMRAGATALLPIYPETFDDVVRFARMAIFAGMVKPLKTGWGDREVVEDERATEARATMVVLQGMELGLPPMASVQLIAMINGRMTVHSEGVPGILLARGFKIKQEFVGTQYEDDFAAVCTLTRPDGEVNVTRFSVSDAKEAGLWQTSPTVKKKGRDKSTYDAPNDSPWFKYRKRMLWARALGFNSKDFASDAMKGLAVAEEVEDMLRSRNAVDITPDVPMIENGVPDIPEIPDDDVPELPPDDETSGLDDPAGDDMLRPDQEEAALANLKDELAAATPGTRMEIVDMYESVIEKMSRKGKDRADAIIEGRA